MEECLLSISVVVLFQFLTGDLFTLQGTPSIDDVGEHEGDEDGDVGHHFERERTGRTVGNSE